jgi:hypothetical protein
VLNQDFKEFFESLNANQVEYLVVGGYAVAFHGHPRYTKDIDIWVAMTPENAEKIIRALNAFGFGSLGLTAADFLTPDQIIQLGYEPSRIDLITTISGVEFSTCYPAHLKLEVDGIQIAVIDRENLAKNKKASGRPQDLADVAELS